MIRTGAEMPSATNSSLQLPNNEDCGIRDVWAHNLEDEFRTIRQVLVGALEDLGLVGSNVVGVWWADCAEIQLRCNGH